jgi:hypothetical protein
MLFAFCIADPHTLQVQRRADNESQASPTDKDVADMIDRMEQILILNTTDENSSRTSQSLPSWHLRLGRVLVKQQKL